MSCDPTSRTCAAIVSHAPVPLWVAAVSNLTLASVAVASKVLAVGLPPSPESWAIEVALLLPVIPLFVCATVTSLACHVWMPTLTAQNGRLTAGARTAWALGMLVAGPVVAPLYYWAHLAPGAEPPLLDEDGPTLVQPLPLVAGPLARRPA